MDDSDDSDPLGEVFLYLPVSTQYPTRKLADGTDFPAVTFATGFLTTYEALFNAIDIALEVGYRSFDISPSNENEHGVGTALEELLPKYNLTRKDVYLITKLPTEFYEAEKASDFVQNTLSNLKTSYVDFCLLQWPGSRDVDPSDPIQIEIRAKAWNSLSALRAEGLIRKLGICNFNSNHLETLLTEESTDRPLLIQTEFHPRFPQKELLATAKENKILVQSQCFQDGFHKRLLSDGTISKVAKSTQKTPTQVILKWILNKGASVIVTAAERGKICENFQLFDFVLEKLQMQMMDGISLREKYDINPICMV